MQKRQSVDLWLFGSTVVLVMVGLLMTVDASYAHSLSSAHPYSAFLFFRRQAIGALLGFACLFVCMKRGYWTYERLAPAAMAGALVLLWAVNLPHVGVISNGASRWLKLGPIQFQPSELAKLVLALYISMRLSRARQWVRSLGSEGLLGIVIVLFMTVWLVEKEPDLGTAAVIFLSAITQMYLAGARKRHIALIVATGAAAVMLVGFAGSGVGHRKHRLEAFFHPDRDPEGIGYQVRQARLAVGSGEITGEGLGRGRAKYYLPQSNSDFVFAVYAEETGLIGCIPLLALLCIVSLRGFQIARRTRNPFGAHLAAGIASVLTWQALMNVAVATGAIPATGVPLPFVSEGSSSLVLLLAAVGILLNISQHPAGDPNAAETLQVAR